MTVMIQPVDITFDCLPLRSVGRLDPPLDAPPEVVEFSRRLREATAKHGLHNTYYLHHARCVFHLTNDPHVGTVAFSFEGIVLTDAEDMKTVGSDLDVEFQGEVCDWLDAAAVRWLAETVRHAVRIEFDRYIAAGDLLRTIARIEELRVEIEKNGGFLGMGL